MNYYENIKHELINNEIYKKVKDYSKNRSDLNTYYNVGKMLSEAGKHYGERIIKEYSMKLTNELGKGYTFTSLTRVKKFYILIEKLATVSQQLTYSHYVELLSINNYDEIKYYIKIIEQNNLLIRELRTRIKSNEYERLEDKVKEKLKYEKDLEIQDLIKNPIILTSDKGIATEKLLQQLILENMDDFLEQLGYGFSYLKSEYKIKIGNSYNYIDLLLYNINYNCYVVIELKIIELKKEHIGQIETYMNYIDKNIKTINQDKTIGIIITKKDNQFIMEYCSDERIFNVKYQLI